MLDLTGERKYRKNFDQIYDPSTMSFSDAQDGQKLVNEYADMVKRIHMRNENEKSKSLHRLSDLRERFGPIIQATEKQTKELKKSPKEENTWNGTDALDFYLYHYPALIDDNYGIRNDNGRFMMGDTEVDIKRNNIYVNGKEYIGTNELWALIMERSPDMHYISKKTIKDYLDLVDQTNVREYAKEKNKNFERLDKYKILQTHIGEGITFLPTNINSLRDRLNLLLAEFNAGNRATRNEIVAIVDNLVDRNKLQKAAAKEINHYLQNVDI